MSSNITNFYSELRTLCKEMSITFNNKYFVIALMENDLPEMINQAQYVKQ